MLAGLCALIWSSLWLVDLAGTPGAGPLALLRDPDVREALSSFSEVTVAVLGIAITVVAIIVELAANRYTPRITELFVSDPVNQLVMSGFVVSSTLVVWINLSLHAPALPTSMMIAAAGLMSASLLSILPYFVYVFDFLSPTRIITHIRRQCVRSVSRVARRGAHAVTLGRHELLTGIEQLGDIALNSVDKKDKPLALSSLAALGELAREMVDRKRRLPDAWFDTSVLARHDQDFIALHPDMVSVLTERRTWVEMKILRQYQGVFGEAVNRMRDVNHLIAIHTRTLAVHALQAGDTHTMQLAIRFLNTYMRASLNARDVRTSYNLLNEYRVLAEQFVHAGEHDAVLDLAQRIKFYGQLAFTMNLAFILESAAYDLCSLLEIADACDATCHDALLDLFLELDREPEGDGKAQEASLRGVRKAQIKLATHYLARGHLPPARRIYEDMRGERRERLHNIRQELEGIVEAEYWEVSDRGLNFEWLPPERRAELGTFFGWFTQSQPAGVITSQSD